MGGKNSQKLQPYGSIIILKNNLFYLEKKKNSKLYTVYVSQITCYY